MKEKAKLSVVAKLSPAEQVDYIKKAMGYRVYAKPPQYWLDTGFPYLNKVMGSKKLGLAYGKIYLIAGKPSSGKSVLAAKLSGLAQKDGAHCGWIDPENSFDKRHVGHQGLDAENVALFEPEYGEFTKKMKDKKQNTQKLILAERPETAEELCTRAEVWMQLQRKYDRDGKVCLVLDSTNAISPEEEMLAGLTDQNMRTKSSSAVFLNLLLKRWVSVAEHTNAIIILIAQLRTNPKTLYGNPDYVSGGNGIIYYPSSITWMRRISNGEILRHGRQVGVMGTMSNQKNKVGGGSREHKKAGYKVMFNEDAWQFMDVERIKKEKEIE